MTPCDSCPVTDCSHELVCRCLKVSHDEIVTALTTLPIRTLSELRAYTGAGDGCMCCHKRLRAYLERYVDGNEGVAVTTADSRQPLPVAVG